MLFNRANTIMCIELLAVHMYYYLIRSYVHLSVEPGMGVLTISPSWLSSISPFESIPKKKMEIFSTDISSKFQSTGVYKRAAFSSIEEPELFKDIVTPLRDSWFSSKISPTAHIEKISLSLTWLGKAPFYKELYHIPLPSSSLSWDQKKDGCMAP